jgi:hypothetical protein
VTRVAPGDCPGVARRRGRTPIKETPIRLVPIAAGIAGLAVIAGLVVHFGAGGVARALIAVGWLGFAAVCLIQLALIAIMGIAWCQERAPGSRYGAG